MKKKKQKNITAIFAFVLRGFPRGLEGTAKFAVVEEAKVRMAVFFATRGREVMLDFFPEVLSFVLGCAVEVAIFLFTFETAISHIIKRRKIIHKIRQSGDKTRQNSDLREATLFFP